MAFPCGQFGGQEASTAEEAETCVRAKYSLSFRLLEKTHVNGPKTHPVFQWLRIKSANPDASAIPWNFNLFLVSGDGQTCIRYGNSRTPSSIREDVLSALSGVPLQKPAAIPKADGDSPVSVVA